MIFDTEIAMRLQLPLAALLVALSLTACSAPAPAPETPQAATSAPAPAASTTPAPAPPAAPQPPKAVPVAPAPVEHADSANPMSPDRTCRTDADCAVKDVGNCCGRFPLCVNKDAKVDPAAVRARCEREGLASTCGFREVGGCQCVKGRCENLPDGAPVAM